MRSLGKSLSLMLFVGLIAGTVVGFAVGRHGDNPKTSLGVDLEVEEDSIFSMETHEEHRRVVLAARVVGGAAPFDVEVFWPDGTNSTNSTVSGSPGRQYSFTQITSVESDGEGPIQVRVVDSLGTLVVAETEVPTSVDANSREAEKQQSMSVPEQADCQFADGEWLFGTVEAVDKVDDPGEWGVSLVTVNAVTSDSDVVLLSAISAYQLKAGDTVEVAVIQMQDSITRYVAKPMSLGKAVLADVPVQFGKVVSVEETSSKEGEYQMTVLANDGRVHQAYSMEEVAPGDFVALAEDHGRYFVDPVEPLDGYKFSPTIYLQGW